MSKVRVIQDISGLNDDVGVLKGINQFAFIGKANNGLGRLRVKRLNPKKQRA
jgi:hypothetical protein